MVCRSLLPKCHFVGQKVKSWVPIWLSLSCSSTQWISVLPLQGVAPSRVGYDEDALRVQVDASAVHLPLRAIGSHIAFIDVDSAVDAAVERATMATKRQLTQSGSQSHTLLVEIVEARAEVASDQLLVQLNVRATLRQKTGNVFVAQTHAHAICTGPLAESNGSQVVRDCAESVALQLRGWLTGFSLGQQPKSH